MAPHRRLLKNALAAIRKHIGEDDVFLCSPKDEVLPFPEKEIAQLYDSALKQLLE